MAEFGQPYRRWNPDGAYDAVVIGSGIGGLGVAALLAGRAEKRVLVLERHATKAGGFTHIFKRKGFEWDAKNLKATNAPEADKFIRREYREGWSLEG